MIFCHSRKGEQPGDWCQLVRTPWCLCNYCLYKNRPRLQPVQVAVVRGVRVAVVREVLLVEAHRRTKLKLPGHLGQL